MSLFPECTQKCAYQDRKKCLTEPALLEMAGFKVITEG
jgi:hypothetical protein